MSVQGMSDRDELVHFAVVTVFMVLATSAVILRLCARHIQKMKLSLNDFLIILGLVNTVLVF